MKDKITKRSLLCFLLIGFAGIQANAQVQKGLDIYGAAMSDLCGRSVSMSGPNTVAISSHTNSSVAASAGYARVFDWSGSAWVQRGAPMTGTNVEDWAGYSVSMATPNTVAVGIPRLDPNFTDAGGARVYDWNGTAWTLRGSTITVQLPANRFGSTVSMGDANTVAIGAPGNDNPATNEGEVRVYEWNGTAWVQKGGDLNGQGPNDQLGIAFDMADANTLALGEPYSDIHGNDAGQVRVFSWSGTAWVQKGTSIAGAAALNYTGAAVDMSDPNTVAVGAVGSNVNGTFSGVLRVYSWNGSAWVQKGADIPGDSANHFLGNTVSMADSNTLTVGGNGGSGFVRAYSWNGSAWVQRGSDILSSSPINDSWGAVVSMGDANTFCGGASNNNLSAINAGQARIFTLCSTSTSTLNPVACSTYTSPSGLYTWSVAGTYQDTIPNAGGCDSVITVNLSIHTVDTSVSFSGGTYTATSSGTYQWVTCPGYTPISGATGQSFSPTANGSYAVIINDGTCSDTSNCHNEQIVGIEDPYQGRLVRVFPNPSSGAFSLAVDGGQQIESVQVVDAAGKRVAAMDVRGESNVVLSLPQASGIYFLHVKMVSGETRFAKVIRE